MKSDMEEISDEMKNHTKRINGLIERLNVVEGFFVIHKENRRMPP
jgi:hypothetical protein